MREKLCDVLKVVRLLHCTCTCSFKNFHGSENTEDFIFVAIGGYKNFNLVNPSQVNAIRGRKIICMYMKYLLQ
jgi:hypothetical protein